MKDAAGIAGRHAAREYSGKILQAGIEDDKRNFTRFFLIRKCAGQKSEQRAPRQKDESASDHGYQRLIPSGANKTSIAYKVKNQPGALFKSLSVFALRDISLSKIESRPLRGRPWEYVFYVDFLRGDDEPARNALRHLSEVAEFVKVLGIYRRGVKRSVTPETRVEAGRFCLRISPGTLGIMYCARRLPIESKNLPNICGWC